MTARRGRNPGRLQSGLSGVDAMTGAWQTGGAALLAAGLALAVVAGGAGAGDDKKQDDKNAVIVTEKDHNGKVKVARGGVVLVKLPVQGGTGFTWVLTKVDRDKVKVGKEETEKPEKPLPGGKVTRVFRFNAEAAGNHDLE